MLRVPTLSGTCTTFLVPMEYALSSGQTDSLTNNVDLTLPISMSLPHWLQTDSHAITCPQYEPPGHAGTRCPEQY